MKFIRRFHGSCSHEDDQEISKEEFDKLAAPRAARSWPGDKDITIQNSVTIEGDAQIVHLLPDRFHVVQQVYRSRHERRGATMTSDWAKSHFDDPPSNAPKGATIISLHVLQLIDACFTSPHISQEDARELIAEAERRCITARRDAGAVPPEPPSWFAKIAQARILYTNHRGEVGWRTIAPWGVYLGSTQYYTEPQTLLRAWDCDKQAERTFAMAKIERWVALPAVVIDRARADFEAGVQNKKERAAFLGGLSTLTPEQRGMPVVEVPAPKFNVPPDAHMACRDGPPIPIKTGPQTAAEIAAQIPGAVVVDDRTIRLPATTVTLLSAADEPKAIKPHDIEEPIRDPWA